jgi:hypothetical protein
MLVVSLIAAFWGIVRYRRRIQVCHALLSSFNTPLLFYDHRDRLVFISSGLVLFRKDSIRPFRRLQTRPVPEQTILGQIDLDFNRYRTRSRLLEYAPGRFGTVVYLDYQGPASAKTHANLT